jgi:hypothetical protein
MAENPLGTLARLLAGVALVQGRFGHQVLGQLLLTGTNDAAVAAAAVVIAGTTKTHHAAAQVALRTAAPAIAVHALLQGEEKRINRLDELVREREKQIDARIARADREHRALIGSLTGQKATLEARVLDLSGERDRLRTQLEAIPPAPVPPAASAPKPRAARRKPTTPPQPKSRGRRKKSGR